MPKAVNILEAMLDAPLVFDGAMGAVIYERGVFINVCYDELNLRNPALIRQIYEDYVDAGADAITLNTFGANAVKLRPYNLADRAAEINLTAAAMGRQVAGEAVYVLGSVGPCLAPEDVLGEANCREVRAAFAEQASALLAGGVDAIILETFADAGQLQLAASEAKAAGAIVIASFAVSEEGRTATGAGAEHVAALLDADANVDVIGLNCGAGPAGLMEPLRTVLSRTSKPVVVMPNAGGPREVGGRKLYLNSPEYFTEYAKRYIEMGVRGVGGCCGTRPEHIRMAARAVKGLSGVKKHVEIREVKPAEGARAVPLAEKSALGAKLAAGERVTSVEFLAPRTGAGMAKLLEKVRQVKDAGVDVINMPDGPRACARVSPMITAIEIERQAGMEVILHYCCRDRNLIGMQSDVLGAQAAGLRNLLIITGDPPKLGNYPDATGVFDVDAIGLTRLVANLNHGYDAAGEPIDPPTSLTIGVGANPVALEMEREVERYFRKIDAGAEYAITQPVFDTDALLRFLDRVEKHERTIPVIAGIFPLVSYKNAEFMNTAVPGVVVPDAVLRRMAECRGKEEARAAGVEIAREAVARIADRVAGVQASAPLGIVEMALAVLAR